MTKKEILEMIEKVKAGSIVPDKTKNRVLAAFNKQLIELEKISHIRSMKNSKIIDSFYLDNQTFVTKEELINEGFEFSQWFSFPNFGHDFDPLETVFQYKDFKCGEYYIKTREKNLEKPQERARLFFQIIKLEFHDNTAEFKKIIKLLDDRKYASGSAWAFRNDSEMQDFNRADIYDRKLKVVNADIQETLPDLKKLIESLTHTHNVFMDLYERLQKEATEDESWLC